MTVEQWGALFMLLGAVGTAVWRVVVFLSNRQKAKLEQAATVQAALEATRAAQETATKALATANEAADELAAFREHVARTYHDRDELRQMFADLKSTIADGLREVRELFVSKLTRRD
jgi:hypothetical protein